MHRTETRACSRCVVVYVWSCFNEAFCDCLRSDILLYSQRIFSSIFSFFQACFSSTRANPRFVRMKQTKTTARLIRTCDTCAHPYLYSTAVRTYYDTTTLLLQCCCMYSGYTSRYSVYYCCACARTRYISVSYTHLTLPTKA